LCGTVSSEDFDSEFSGVLENVLSCMNIESYVYVFLWSRTAFERLEMETKEIRVFVTNYVILCLDFN
jgi:hypothetical protein